MAKRYEKMKEIIRAREVTKKAILRQRIGKRALEAKNHGKSLCLFYIRLLRGTSIVFSFSFFFTLYSLVLHNKLFNYVYYVVLGVQISFEGFF